MDVLEKTTGDFIVSLCRKLDDLHLKLQNIVVDCGCDCDYCFCYDREQNKILSQIQLLDDIIFKDLKLSEKEFFLIKIYLKNKQNNTVSQKICPE